MSKGLSTTSRLVYCRIGPGPINDRRDMFVFENGT